MKKALKILSFAALWLISLASIAINFNGFLVGSSDALDLIVTIVYLAAWIAYAILNKNRRQALAMAVFSAVSLLVALVCFPIALFRLDGGFIAIFAIVFLPQYNGLALITGSRWEIVYPIVIVFTAAVTALALRRVILSGKKAAKDIPSNEA